MKDDIVDLFPETSGHICGRAWGVLIPPNSDSTLVKVEVMDGEMKVVQSFSSTNFSEWAGCVYDIPNKTVRYYLDPEDWSKKYSGTYHGVFSDGSASDLTGADGDVLVEIPKTYFMYGIVQSGDYTNYAYALFGASPFQFQDRTSEVDNAFMVGSNSETLPKEHIYHAAYEGVLCNKYGEPLKGENSPVWTDGCKIRSISEGTVFASANQAIMEIGYRNAGWHGSNWAIESFITKTMIAHFGTRDLQSSPLGAAFAHTSLFDYSYARRTGLGNCIGNGCGAIEFESTKLEQGISLESHSTMKNVVFKFLGIENPYGNIWKLQFGMHKESSTTYRYTLNPDDHPTTTAQLSDLESGRIMYSNSIDLNLQTINSHVKVAELYEPIRSSIALSSSSCYCDYYYYAFGLRQSLCGDQSGCCALVGPFYVDSNSIAFNAIAVTGCFGSL